MKKLNTQDKSIDFFIEISKYRPNDLCDIHICIQKEEKFVEINKPLLHAKDIQTILTYLQNKDDFSQLNFNGALKFQKYPNEEILSMDIAIIDDNICEVITLFDFEIDVLYHHLKNDIYHEKMKNELFLEFKRINKKPLNIKQIKEIYDKLFLSLDDNSCIVFYGRYKKENDRSYIFLCNDLNGKNFYIKNTKEKVYIVDVVCLKKDELPIRYEDVKWLYTK